MIRIQVLNSIVWNTQTTIEYTDNLPSYMEYVKQSYPDRRVRAIDEEGRILDMIP